MEFFLSFIRQMLNGIQVGSVYALIALGYTMVYGVVKLINFAHGDFIMVGSYVSLLSIPFLIAAGIPAWLSVIVAVIVCSLLGILTEKLAYKPLRNSPRITPLITAIAVSLLLQNLFLIVFGSASKPYPAIIKQQIISIGPIDISSITIITILVSILCMVLLTLFVNKTRLGKSVRALSEDMGASMLMGINVNSSISLTFAIGSGLAAIAAVMYCSSYPLVSPFIGSMLGLKAFVAAVLGGIGIIPGAMIGGFLIGIAESMTKAYISSQLADAVVFGILILVLLVKPTGLLGKNLGEKV